MAKKKPYSPETIDIGAKKHAYFGENAERFFTDVSKRNFIFDLVVAAMRSTNRHFVVGELNKNKMVVIAAQSTRLDALDYMSPGRVLVSIDESAVGGTGPQAIFAAAPIVYPTINDTSIPDGATCQETTGMIGEQYLRCGRPASCIVKSPHPNEPAPASAYYMCLACGDHNVRNRNCKLIYSK